MIEFATNLPMVKLLWSIVAKLRSPNLSKAQIETATVQKNDIFTIFAAILNLQVENMLVEPEAMVHPTGNPLLFLNDQSQIIFLNFNDLRKFSIKFSNFKEQYHKQEDKREIALGKVKKIFLDQ